MLMWLSLTIIEAEVSFAYALEAAPLRVAMATTREKNFIIILILLTTCWCVDRLVYGMKVQGQKIKAAGGKARRQSAKQATYDSNPGANLSSWQTDRYCWEVRRNRYHSIPCRSEVVVAPQLCVSCGRIISSEGAQSVQ